MITKVLFLFNMIIGDQILNDFISF